MSADAPSEGARPFSVCAGAARGADTRGRTETGDAAEAILRVADAEGADLNIMGGRGPGGLKSLVVGSVSQKVSHLANCTCITVK